MFYAKCVRSPPWRGSFDVSRVYITGASNGAMFTYRLLHEMPRARVAMVPPDPAAGGYLFLEKERSGDSI